MKLRNFLYLNTKIINDYLSSIEGYLYDEEDQSIATSSEKAIKAGIGIKAISGDGSRSGKTEDEQIKYYECLSEQTFNDLCRDDFLEVLVTVRFSKMKELTNTVKKLNELATVFQEITDQQLLDKQAREAVAGFAALEQLESGKSISCVFNFEDGKYPLVAYLDENYFKCEQDSFIGESYMVCKVIRKIPKGKNVKLDEIFDDIKKIPMNRQQRRKMPKNMDNPDELKDVVKGPALVVVPIAVYQ